MISLRIGPLAAPVILGLLVSCASSPKVDMGLRPSNVQPDDYTARFKEWSREIRVIPFNGLDNILTARSTYLSYRFREAYVERMSRDLHASSVDKDRLRTEAAAGLAGGNEFFVTLMSAVKNCENLDLTEGPWTIRLKNAEGIEAAPLTVEEIKKPKPDQIKYFAFNPAYRKAFKIVFPLAAEDGSLLISENTRFFELTFANAYGRGVARWEIADR